MAAKPSLEQLLKDVNLERQNQPCTDYHLSKIAQHVTRWETIAPHLRLEAVDEHDIVTKYPNDGRAQSLEMLRRWKEKNGDKATYRRLAEVFWNVDRVDLAERVSKVITSECSSSESEGKSEQGCVGGSESQRWTVPQYASYLKLRYRTAGPPIQNDLLLPSPTRTVFNLALIQKERLEFGPNEELVRLLQRGQVKEAAESHTEIELSNLMRADDEERKIILIEGAPGSGKSTLAWHICQQWEKGELFTEYEVVVFVQLRDPKVQSAKAVTDILPVPSHNMDTAVASLLTGDNRWGKGVLLVLDGWDELQPDCPAYSLLMQLVQIPDYLNMVGSSLIITSRPVSSLKLQCYASSRVEVLGFKPEEVQQYFKACFGRNHELFTSFVGQLKERPVIEASCFLPINAVIVFITFNANNCSLPHTLHKVFEKLVLSYIVCHVTDREEFKSRFSASCLGDLPSDIEVPLLALSSLAFHCVWVNKAVFSEKDLKVFNLPIDLNSTFSLVQVVESFGVCGHSKSYNFFHLQIQELLAAYHISKLEEDEQVRIFKDLFGQPRFAAVFQFYAAFTKLQAKGIREVLVDMLKDRKYHTTTLHCVYEAQDLSLCQFVGHTLRITTKPVAPYFHLWSQSSPLYIIALGYFLCYYCYYCSEELSVSVSNVVNMKLLVKEFLKHQSHITADNPQCQALGSLAFELTLSDDCYWESFIQDTSEPLSSLNPFITRLVFIMWGNTNLQKLLTHLSTPVERYSSLQHLDVCGQNKTVSVIEPDLFRYVHFNHGHEQLHTFQCYAVTFKISDSAIETVCQAMAINSAIKYLLLHDCQFDTPISLFNAIEISNHLKVIDLTGTTLGECVCPLLMGLATNTSVVELILEGCKVDLTGENGQALSNMLSTNTTLRALNLRGSWHVVHVGGNKEFTRPVDLQTICVSLTSNTSLAYLDLSGCRLRATAESGRALTDMLQTNTTLRSLKLDNNYGMSNEGAVCLAQGLAQNTGLETLSIAKCAISTAVVQLAEALTTNKCLLSLDISRNTFVRERFVRIVRSLQVNSTLRDLRARECGITHTAIVDIVRSSLESLDLSGNPIRGEGAEHIAQFVINSRSLYQLNLGMCDIGDRGVECLASSLEGNTSLEILHIPKNEVTDTGLLALGGSLKRNKALKTLDVAKCGTEVGRKQFVLSLCENEHLTYLCLSHDDDGLDDEVSDEVDKVNQTRRDKNRNSLSTFN